MNREYYYLDGEEQKGPLTVDQLKTVGIKSDTLVWTEGMDDWKPAKEVEELKSILRRPPPTPPVRSNKSFSSPSVKPHRPSISIWHIVLTLGVLYVAYAGFIYYSEKNSDDGFSISSFLSNPFSGVGKKSLSGVYEPVSSKGWFSRIEFFRDGTFIMTTSIFNGAETSGQYTITDDKVIIDDGKKSTPFFEIKDSNTLLTMPVLMVFERGEVWKKKK